MSPGIGPGEALGLPREQGLAVPTRLVAVGLGARLRTAGRRDTFSLEPRVAGPTCNSQKSEPGQPGVEAEAPPRPARPTASGESTDARGRVGGRACGDCPELGLPPARALAALQAARRRRGAVQPQSAGSLPSAYLCAAVLASRMPAPCIQERTEPRPAGSSGSSFRFSPPRGRASCAGNIGARGGWAPPARGIRAP